MMPSGEAEDIVMFRVVSTNDEKGAAVASVDGSECIIDGYGANYGSITGEAKQGNQWMSELKQTGSTGCRGVAGPGRPKGSQNKLTGILKDAIIVAGENAGSRYGNQGLVSYLQEQAVQNPVAFMTLLGKVLPLQVATGSENQDTIIEVTFVGLEPRSDQS